MLPDHQNLLSTFGKDSQSSNRKSRDYINPIKNKKNIFPSDMQPRSRYQKILSQRKTIMMLQKLQQSSAKLVKPGSKKLRTQSDIDYLNTRIRKSISNIAETICKSKIKSHIGSKCTQFEESSSSVSKRNAIEQTKQNSHYQKSSRINDLKKRRISLNDKENMNLNNIRQIGLNSNQQSKRNKVNDENWINKNEYLKNSTKKKGKFSDQQNQCPIKSSFSIDLYSDMSSVMQSSRKQFMERKYSKNNLYSNLAYQPETRLSQKRQALQFLPAQSQNRSNREQNNSLRKIQQLSNYKKQIAKRQFSKPFHNKYPEVSIGKKMQQTLKKQFKLLSESNYDQQPKLLQTKGNRNMAKNPEFLFYEEELQNQNKQNILSFNKIQIPTNINTKKKTYTENVSIKNNLLMVELMHQIELDYDLRHAKHMFSGIQQPFYAPQKDQRSQCKWQRLNNELKGLGLYYSVETIKKIFLPSEEQIDPFLSVGKPHQQLIFSLIYAYETAEINWEQKIYQKWQHWNLRDIQLTIQKIDRQRKGYISVQDVAAFISMQSGHQYKNRDVILIYKRLINGFSSIKNKQNQKLDLSAKAKLKFRDLIDCLIKPFSHSK